MNELKALNDTDFLRVIVAEMLDRGMDPESIELVIEGDGEPDADGLVEIIALVSRFDEEEKEVLA